MSMEKNKVIDGDNMRVLEMFNPSEEAKIIEKYCNLGYGSVCTDADGDVIVYEEEEEDSI